MRTLKILISGSVQGVFFRNFVQEKADKLELKGFCRNLENGRVEVVVEGRDENVDKMLAECKKGPAHSEIKNIETQELKHQDLKGFKVLRI